MADHSNPRSSMMDNHMQSAVDKTFAIPELLEHILSFLPCQLLPLTDHEDPRSVRVHGNARVLQHLLRCSEVCRRWSQCIKESKLLQRALYLSPDYTQHRAWDHSMDTNHAKMSLSYYVTLSLRAPQLNPVIQTIFGAYHFRFWHLSLESTGNKHCAYLIISRRDMAAVDHCWRTGRGKSISKMLLSQPPCTTLEAMVWEERDETKDYIGRTSVLKDPIIRCEQGVTIGLVHERVNRMLDEHRDVAAIKLTTV